MDGAGTCRDCKRSSAALRQVQSRVAELEAELGALRELLEEKNRTTELLDAAGVNAYPANWMTVDANAVLQEANVEPREFVRISMQLVPSSDLSTAPTLVDWRQRFDCVDAQ